MNGKSFPQLTTLNGVRVVYRLAGNHNCGPRRGIHFDYFNKVVDFFGDQFMYCGDFSFPTTGGGSPDICEFKVAIYGL